VAQPYALSTSQGHDVRRLLATLFRKSLSMFRRFALLMMVAVIFVTAPGRLAGGVEVAQKRPQTAVLHVSNATAPRTYADNDATHGRGASTLAGDWRCLHHNGRHWYWMQNKTWRVWHGGAWLPYSAGMFSQVSTSFGRQVTGYRGVPSSEEVRQPMNGLAPAGGQYSSPGPSMPNEHFMHP
jgi:hypothetical protein